MDKKNPWTKQQDDVPTPCGLPVIPNFPEDLLKHFRSEKKKQMYLSKTLTTLFSFS